MRTLGVSVELSLPCCSYSAAGIRSPALERKLLFSSETRRTSFSSSSKYNPTRWTQSKFNQTSTTRNTTKCRATENPNEQPVTAPVQLESPTGQLLLQIIKSHPHLLPATVDQQLERLQIEKDEQKEEAETRSPQDLLFKRISEVKDKERQKSLEEILYCLILQKFADKNISLIPKISGEIESDSYSNQESKFTSIHSSDAMEMIQSHISIILGERSVGPLSTIVQISKLKLGKLYAASVMYGYFLKRVDERFQLERSMKTLPDVKKLPKMFDGMKPNPFWDLESMVQITEDGEEYNEDNNNQESQEEGYKLRSYVMYLDAETLQRYATMRSKEAVGIIEKQTQALFGRPDIVIADDGSFNAVDDESLTVSFQGLTILVLEAVAFGSFLWEAEGYVDSKYRFINV